MAYSKSKKAVRRVKNYLDQMLAAEKNISFPSKNPSRLSYQIREGCYAAQFHLDCQKYAGLDKTKFKIRILGSTVLCESREVTAAMLKRSTVLSVPEVTESLGIIGAAIKHKADKMVFPDANLSTIPNPKPLQDWAAKNDYLVVWGDKVELVKKDFVETEED